MKDPYLYPHTLQNNALEAGEYEIEGQYGMEKGCNVYRQYYIDI